MEANIPIWGELIPGNNDHKKTDVMNIGRKGPKIYLMAKAGFAMGGTTLEKPEKKKKLLDTAQYYNEIAAGFRPEAYQDKPCIDYYPCEGAEKAALIIPGGGFTFQSNIGVPYEKQSEGGAMAIRLNKAGIAAFVLSRHRLSPYRMPIPLLDAQRAVRYIKYHSRDFGINPDKLGIMGFSAGGFQSVGTITITRNRSVNEILEAFEMPDIEYTSDEVDKTDAACAFAGLIYPMLGFRSTIPIMFSCFPSESVKDENKRNILIERFDPANYVQPGDIPQFIAMGTKDTVVDLTDDKTRYMEALKKNGVPFKYLPLEGANHGFGASSKKYGYWVDEYINWINSL